MKVKLIIYIILFFTLIFSTSKNEKQTLPFNAREMFGNNHPFAEGTNDITSIEVLGLEEAPDPGPLPELRAVNLHEPEYLMMRLLFDTKLTNVRNHNNETQKLEAKNFILRFMVNYLGKENVYTSPFLVNADEYFVHFLEFGKVFKGTNIIGILKGPKYGEKGDDVFIIGAHWDSVENCPGVDDNGSGVVAVLELVRILSVKKATITFTIFFVLFDFEEYGLIGSYVFTSSFIAPNVIDGSMEVIGMYNFDMVLNYNSSNNSQILSSFLQTSYFNVSEKAILKSSPEIAEEIINKGSKGDFIAIISRKQHDDRLSKTILTAFKSFRSKIALKIYNFQAPLSKLSSGLTDEMRSDYGYFMSSDHTNFWYPYFANQTKSVWNLPYQPHTFTINAVTFSDTAKYRGIQRKCYHKPCDNETQLTDENLEFLSTVIKTAVISIDILIGDQKPQSNEKPISKWVILSLFLLGLAIFGVCSLILIVYVSNKTIQSYNTTN